MRMGSPSRPRAAHRCLAIGALLSALVQPAAASARTISNTAYLQWQSGSATLTASSNRVDLDFADAQALATLVPTGGTLPAGALQSSCAAVGTPAAPATAPLQGVALTATSSLYAGRSLILSVANAAANRNPAAIDSFVSVVTTSTGDRETLRFIETGADNGVFLAAVRTAAMPPAATPGDCALSVTGGATLSFDLRDDATGPPTVAGSIGILIDPFGTAFDSRDGAAVAGVRVTLVDAATGAPATVYGDDGVSSYPSTVVTGQAVTDSGGTTYSFPAGDYRFPLVAPGSYRLLVQPVSPYSFPSALTAAEMSGLRRSDGEPFDITAASYGLAFSLTVVGSVRNDIPLDRPAAPILIQKSVSQTAARSGDLLRYQITLRNPGFARSGAITVADRYPEQMRFRPGTARLNGVPLADPVVTGDRALRFAAPGLAPNASEVLSYILEVRPGARTGDAVNQAQASADGLTSNIADASVRIEDDAIAERMVIIGRVLGGGCSASPRDARGVPGVRVMLEDGSYAVTDYQGRYHFEGVKPGTHVVQLDRATVPAIAEPVLCGSDVRNGGRASSRFVDGLGGELKRVDFRLGPASGPAPAAGNAAEPPAMARSPVASDAAAAGADRDWLAGQAPGIDFLFPTIDTNPRSPVVRVVVKHYPGQKARLLVDGRPADPLAFEGTLKSAISDVAISKWRGIPLPDRATALEVRVEDAAGKLVSTLRRTVYFANTPAHVELVPAQSSLIADGVHRPVLALRITDRGGRPIHQGVAGEFELPEPYYPAMEADAQQARQLAGLERARPAWHVLGDDGIAFVELEPTTASGSLAMRFAFREREIVREQRLEAWLSPGHRPWTIVGLAEGSFGFNRLKKKMESFGATTPRDVVDGRLALYAKGRILGRWLLTLSYDSDKRKGDQPFGGVIDPDRYYTIYADRSERRYDAASVRKLYIRLERPQFYALFGDYETAIDEPQLARYVRALNGVKAEYRSKQVSALAFGSDTPLHHRRDEIQGNGLSGPYALKARYIVPNSERITLQTRDRFRSEKIVDERVLARHIDYDIDYERGTLVFRSPVLSRSSSLDPQIIIADYDVDGAGATAVNAGGRVAWRSKDQRAQVGATVIHDNNGATRTDLVGADAKIRVSATTEVRAEIAASRATDLSSKASATSTAWLVEVEHHDGRLDALAYAGQRDEGFGVGQTNSVENGTRKFGVDGRWYVNDALSVSASAWRQVELSDGASRTAARLLGEYRRGDLSGHAGLTFAHDDLATGGKADSTLLVLGGSKRFLRDRLELGFDSEIPIGQQDDSVDFPSRHRLTARFSVVKWASLIGSYEIAKGDAVDARTARLGFDLAPWTGARIAMSGNLQDIPEYGRRTFAALGLAQSIVVSKSLSLDFTVDSNRTVGGIDPATVIDALHPVASGGFIGDGGRLTEDFTAVTAGATYRRGPLSLTTRGEYRRGDRERRTGLLLGALRQIGEGRALAASLDWFRARGRDGATTSVADGSLMWANRPANRPLAWLDKLEFRRDAVSGALPGSADPLGNPLTIIGDARSTRVINSLTVNYSTFDQRAEVSVFWGSRYVSDRFGSDDVKGWSNVIAADGRLSLGSSIEVGVAASARLGVGSRSLAYSFGPQLGLKPATNAWVVLGYNVAGYRDRDFAADRFTRSGAYITLRVKFDQLSLQGLALMGRR